VRAKEFISNLLEEPGESLPTFPKRDLYHFRRVPGSPDRGCGGGRVRRIRKESDLHLIEKKRNDLGLVMNNKRATGVAKAGDRRDRS